jgi:aldose 1-epimerase
MVEEFGKTSDGQTVHRVRIGGGGLSVAIITWGAAIQDLRLEGHAAPLVLGFPALETYIRHPIYVGAVVGRFANRIAGGRFSIDGQTFQADTDFLGRHTLHGGSHGFDKRVWTIEDHGPDFVRLARVSPDGEMGFPGTLTATCTYRIAGEGRLAVELEATTDAATPCNLSQHSYFNLDDGGASPVIDHGLRVAADRYLPVDGELIPTGEVPPVADTRFDFREMRPIRNGADGGAHAIHDLNFCLSDARGPLRPVAWLRGARSGVTMELASTETGLQFYDGVNIDRGLAGLDGIAYGPHSGLCLEPQAWPDAPNRPNFPPAILGPGEVYRNVIEYGFGRTP